MAKISLVNIFSGFNLNKINDNFKKIEDTLNYRVLYRNNVPGEDNTLSNDIDINGHKIYNLGAPTGNNHAARLQDVKDAIAGFSGQVANLIKFSPVGAITSDNVQGAIEQVEQEVLKYAKTVARYGAKGDGIADDTIAIQNAIASGGVVMLMDNAKHKITSPLSIDLSKVSLIGNGSVIDASASSGGALIVYSSASYGDERLQRNWTHKIEGVSFKGNKVAGSVLVTVGHPTYLNNSDITFRNCSFKDSGTLVKFIDNAWRANFDHCGFETPVGNPSYYIYFNSAANAGEVMRFAHCWFVDGANSYIFLREGQWVFDSCSFPGGGIGGIQCVGAPHVVIRDCNLETQSAAANQKIVEAYGSSFVLVDGCIISTNGGAANQPLLTASDAAGMRITNCTLPLYGGDLHSEASGVARELVGGNSPYVSCQDNYVKGTGANDRLGWAVVSHLTNLLYNGDAESGDTRGWSVMHFGADLVNSSFSSVTQSPKNGSNCFKIDCSASAGLEVTQTISGASQYAGRAVVFGMWVKAVGGVGNVDFPTVKFLNPTGDVISSTSIGFSSADTSWTWIGGYSPVPIGTDKIVMVITGQEQNVAHQNYYDNIILNVI